MNKKYPASLFWTGFIMNLIKRFILLLAGIILLIVGNWVNVCSPIGAALLILTVILAFMEQIQIRNTMLNSDNPEFAEWQDAILSPNWKENIMDLTETKIKESENTIPSHCNPTADCHEDSM